MWADGEAQERGEILYHEDIFTGKLTLGSQDFAFRRRHGLDFRRTAQQFENGRGRTADVARIQPLLRPGDIILVRRNWKLSNSFLQGFWTHSALYTGTLEDLEGLGILDRPEVTRHLENYRRSSLEGKPYTVIEALGEGVIFNPFSRTIFADYAVVLRPRLSEEQIAEVLVKAFTR